jgi:hypothetical protein
MFDMNYTMIQGLCAIANSGIYNREECGKQLHDAIDMLNELYDLMDRYKMHGASIKCDVKSRAFDVLWRYYDKYNHEDIVRWESERREKESLSDGR